ncbi:MAG: leucine-rich repeat protein [Clostridia bacterium]|nr:leucine-rich repeat protein [Clostridia bacterium]
MNKTKKGLTVLLASLLGACLMGFVACTTDDPHTPPDDPNNQVTDKTVTFYDGESVYTNATGKPGDTIEALTLPVKTGYTFSGWKTADGTDFVPEKIPADDIKVYSSFTANNYKIVLDPNGGTGSTVKIDAVYDTEITIPEVSFKKGNGYVYTLTGWAKTQTADAADYLLRGSVKNLTAVADETVTLYAVYTNTATAEDDFVIIDNMVAAYLGEETVITLPDTCTSVAEGAFADNKTLREVVVPECYTEIGFGAFEGCDNIEKMTLPFIGGSLTENTFLAYIFGAANYRDNTFAYNLTNVGTGDSAIDESSLTGSFYIPRTLRTVVITTAIEEIPEGAFYYAYGLEKVIAYRFTDDEAVTADSVYSYRIKKVGDSAFEGCHKIGNDAAANIEYYMEWLSGVEEFGAACFKGYVAQNDYFTSNLFTLGELKNVKVIGDEAFRYNSKLCDFKLGDKLERIGKQAFANANLLQRVIIPDSCVYIGESAFEQCIYLGSVTIGSGVKTIGENAFAYSAALTEVFFKNGLPENLARNAFYGLDINSDTERLLTDVNPGTVFYFDTQERATAAESVLKAQYPTISTGVTKPERGPLYYVGQTYEFYMTFSGGHTVIISDPLYRIGFGLPELVGTYEKMEDVWYGAEIYNITLMLDLVFRSKIDYYLSAKYTHYYIYRVETFTFDEVRDEVTAFKVGNKETDEWYLEENVYGQIGLWHNGEMVELDKANGATYCVGGVSQFYDDRGMRTMMYRQGNEYFESVLEYDFIYVPKEGTKDDLLTYYGTLYLDTTGSQRFLYGTYETGDKDYKIFVDEVVNKIRIDKGGETLVNGTYTTDSEYTDEKFTLNVTDMSGKTVTVNFTDFLDNIVDGNYKRSFYARCNFTIDGEKHVLYNNNYTSYTESYWINKGKLSNDYYILIQYHQRILEGDGENAYEFEVYPGFGEHTYTVNNKEYHDYLTYNYTEGVSGFIYQFVIDEGEPKSGQKPIYLPGEDEKNPDYIGTVTDEFVGTFSAKVPGTQVSRSYSPYFIDEDNKTFTDGEISITLSGYGTATYTDADGNTISGSYNIASDTVVKQVYVESNIYYNLVEYIFKSSDGNTEIYFVPNFHDAYDGSMKAGDMFLPDESRNRTYRVYDKDGWCTGQFSSSGYGMGIFYIMVDPETALVTSIDNTFFCPGATYAYYTEIGEKDGKPLYRLTTGLNKGFFSFQFTNRLSKGHREDNMSNSFAFEMDVDIEYDEWWRGPAALYVTGSIEPELEEMERMVAREEIGVYTSPNGYTLELDGKGTALLRKPDGTLIHTASYTSIDENKLGLKKFKLVYTIDGTTYTGVIDIIDADKRDKALIALELTVDGVVLNNFARGTGENYTAANGSEDFGTLSIYAGDNVGEYKVDDGKNVYNLGDYEVDEKTGNYIFRFNDKKLVVTLSSEAHTYTVVNVYRAIKVKAGDYVCSAYYGWRENEPMRDEEGNVITDEDGNPKFYPHTTLYGYEVRANANGNAIINYNSEYRGSIIDTANNKYWYMTTMYDAEIICYEDGEFAITYDHIGIIRLTNVGKYIAEDAPENDTGKAMIVLDKGNAICVYRFAGEAVG